MGDDGLKGGLVSSVKMTQILRDGGEFVAQNATDSIAQEQRISMYLNGKKIISTMAFPRDQDAHAVGFLMNEAVIESVCDITSIEVSDDGLKVFVEAKINEEALGNLYFEKTLTTGCCVGVSANFDGKLCEKFIDSPLSITASKVFEIMDLFYKDADLFNTTGCVHRALLYFLESAESSLRAVTKSRRGNPLFEQCSSDSNYILADDIGRHNAIDKVTGRAYLNGLDTSKSILVVSGRLSMEMVIKASMANVPMIISKAAPTSLGIAAAKRLGITLIAFARNNRFNIYTYPGRVKV